MPKVATLTESLSVQDIMDTMNYRFELGQVPGAGNDRFLSIQCNQATYPGITNEVYPVVFPGGHELSYRGRKVYPKTLSVTYVESRRMNVTRTFGRWFEFINDLETGSASGYKAAYAIDGPKLWTFDITGKIVDTITFFGLQPTDKPDISYDPSSAQPYIINITMNYDFYYSSLFGRSAPSQDGGNASLDNIGDLFGGSGGSALV